MKKETKGKIYDLRLFEITCELNDLREHLARIEPQVEAHSQRDFSTQPIARLEDEKWLSDEEIIDGHAFWVETSLSRLYRGPFLISVYSVFEAAVIEIAESIKEKKGLRLSIDDINGSFTDRAKKYYTHVLHFTLIEDHNHWSNILDLSTIRNAIAHTNGRTKLLSNSNLNKLETLESKEIGFRIRDGYLSIESQFVQSMHNSTQEFLESLISRYKEWDNDRKNG